MQAEGSTLQALTRGSRCSVAVRIGPSFAVSLRMIVLISGWAGIRASLIPMEVALRRRVGRPVTRADVGFGLGCIRESAELTASQLYQLTRGRDEPVDLVGYSMGGLVATYLLKAVDRGERVRSVVTLGTPHRGAPALRWGRGLLAPWSASLEQMFPGCDFLEELAAAPVPEGARLVSVASHGDRLVPPAYAELPPRTGHHNRVLWGVSHFGMLVSGETLDVLEPLLARPVTRSGRSARPAPRPPSTRAAAGHAR
jgi:pimeloyl-ACP methyl ester carboxylesterase